MERVDFATLEAEAAAFDSLAATTPGIDAFCSSTCWTLPALHAFQTTAESFVWRDNLGWAAFALGESPTVGRYLLPLEAAWGLACPVVSDTPDATMHDLAAALTATDERWNVVLIAALEVGSPTWRAAIRAMAGRFRVGVTEETVTHVSSLDGGIDGFLGRRTRKFRANLRNAERRAAGAGVTFHRVRLDDPEQVDAWYDDVLAIERASWKSLEGNGADTEPMRGFTREVLRRSAAREGCRLIIARLGEHDIGYLHGAVYRRRFRGLQMSFDARWTGLGLGNLLQMSMIRWACEDGLTVYDLGSDLDYKRRWAELQVERRGLVLTRK